MEQQNGNTGPDQQDSPTTERKQWMILLALPNTAACFSGTIGEKDVSEHDEVTLVPDKDFVQKNGEPGIAAVNRLFDKGGSLEGLHARLERCSILVAGDGRIAFIDNQHKTLHEDNHRQRRRFGAQMLCAKPKEISYTVGHLPQSVSDPGKTNRHVLLAFTRLEMLRLMLAGYEQREKIQLTCTPLEYLLLRFGARLLTDAAQGKKSSSADTGKLPMGEKVFAVILVSAHATTVLVSDYEKMTSRIRVIPFGPFSSLSLLLDAAKSKAKEKGENWDNDIINVIWGDPQKYLSLWPEQSRKEMEEWWLNELKEAFFQMFEVLHLPRPSRFCLAGSSPFSPWLETRYRELGFEQEPKLLNWSDVVKYHIEELQVGAAEKENDDPWALKHEGEFYLPTGLSSYSNILANAGEYIFQGGSPNEHVYYNTITRQFEKGSSASGRKGRPGVSEEDENNEGNRIFMWGQEKWAALNQYLNATTTQGLSDEAKGLGYAQAALVFLLILGTLFLRMPKQNEVNYKILIMNNWVTWSSGKELRSEFLLLTGNAKENTAQPPKWSKLMEEILRGVTGESVVLDDIHELAKESVESAGKKPKKRDMWLTKLEFEHPMDSRSDPKVVSKGARFVLEGAVLPVNNPLQQVTAFLEKLNDSRESSELSRQLFKWELKGLRKAKLQGLEVTHFVLQALVRPQDMDETPHAKPTVSPAPQEVKS